MQNAKRLILAVLSLTLLAATAGRIAPANRKAFCRGEVSEMYATKPIYVRTEKLRLARDRSTWVSGTVDKGNEGSKKFKCRFDVRGRFIDVMAMTPDGE